MKEEELLLENQFCHALYSASNALQRAYKKILDPLGITYPQYLILLSLWEQDSVNIQVLSEATYFDSGTISPLLKKMVVQKLIEVRSAAEDRRHKIVCLTNKGRELRKKAFRIPGAVGCLMPYTAAQFAEMQKQLRLLRQSLVSLELPK